MNKPLGYDYTKDVPKEKAAKGGLEEIAAITEEIRREMGPNHPWRDKIERIQEILEVGFNKEGITVKKKDNTEELLSTIQTMQEDLNELSIELRRVVKEQNTELLRLGKEIRDSGLDIKVRLIPSEYLLLS